MLYFEVCTLLGVRGLSYSACKEHAVQPRMYGADKVEYNEAR